MLDNTLHLRVGHSEGNAMFPTLEQALAFAGKHDAQHITITLEAGRHYIESPIEIRSDSKIGQKAALVIRGSGKLATTLTGAQTITPDWRAYGAHMQVAQIGPDRKIDALYVNEARQVMARYPNEQPGAVLAGFSQDAVSPERAARWKNPKGGYVRALHDREWGSNSYFIDGKTDENQLLLRWVGDNNRGREMHAVKRMVENIFEELDAPREWFYNPESGELFFWPEDAASLPAARIEIVTTEELFRLVGTEQTPVQHVIFENLAFAQTHRTLFTRPYERPLRGDWGMARAGAIYLENTEHICIADAAFTDIGGNAVMMSGYNRDNAVVRSDFSHIGATGVLMMGLLSSVREPSMYDGDLHRTAITDYTPGPQNQHYPREILVKDNYFYDVGVYEKQTAAVCMSISSKITVAGNTVHHTARAGINIHDGTFGGHLIEGNDLFDCVTETADHGPINCWGRDRYWSVPQHDAMGYYGREKRPFALLDAVDTTVIRANRVHANHAFGIDIDDGASHYDIYNNLCIGVGIKLRDGFDRRVHNNLLIGSGFELHMSFAQNNDLIYTNVVCNQKAYNMLCVNPGATTIVSNNLYWNMGKPVAGLPDQEFAAQIADPLFRDFAGNDFSLQAQSPALQMGFVNFPMCGRDFGCADRPKPPAYVYIETEADQTHQFYDVLLCNITNDGIRSAAGLPDFKGVYIADRDVLGLFCKLGLPIGIGDVIRKIADADIDCIDDFLREFARMPLNKPITIRFFRSQLPQELEFIKQTNDYQSIYEEATTTWQSSAPLLYQ